MNRVQATCWESRIDDQLVGLIVRTDDGFQVHTTHAPLVTVHNIELAFDLAHPPGESPVMHRAVSYIDIPEVA